MWKTSKTIFRLEQMLDDAMNGCFVEQNYDETQLSRLETRFRQYLTAKEAAADRTEAERAALKELVTDISHQTKTPLANILLYTQLLQEKCTDENAAPYIRQIQSQTEKLEFLIQALIKISRLESGMIELHPEELSVVPLLEQALSAAEGRAREKNMEIELNFGKERKSGPLQKQEAGCIRAYYDLRWTLEALGNLLDNAVKYAPSGSRIIVNAYALETFFCISVEDEGPGIEEGEMAQIFKRFYRGKQALHEEGSGVGLYLTRMILEKENGFVKAASGKGKGSCFSMYLMKSLQK